MTKLINIPLSAANTYVSVEEASAYFETRLNASSWVDALSSIQESALITASNYLDQNFDWEGCKVFDAQSMDWPRSGVVSCDAGCDVTCNNVCGSSVAYIDSDSIPDQIKDATLEMSLNLLNNNTEADMANVNRGIKTAKVDVLSVTYFENGRNMIKTIPDSVRKIVGCLGKLAGAGWSRLIRY